MLTSSRCTAGGSARAATATCITSCDAFISLGGRRAGPRSFRQRYGRHVCVMRVPQMVLKSAPQRHPLRVRVQVRRRAGPGQVSMRLQRSNVNEMYESRPFGCIYLFVNQPIATNQPCNQQPTVEIMRSNEAMKRPMLGGTKPQHAILAARSHRARATMQGIKS